MSYQVFRDATTWHLRKYIVELREERNLQLIERCRCFFWQIESKKQAMLDRADKIQGHWL